MLSVSFGIIDLISSDTAISGYSMQMSLKAFTVSLDVSSYHECSFINFADFNIRGFIISLFNSSGPLII